MKDTVVNLITNLQEESFWLGLFVGLLVALLFSILYTSVVLWIENRELKRQLAEGSTGRHAETSVAHGSTKATLNPATGRLETAQFSAVATEPRRAVRPAITPEHEVTR